MRILRLLGAVLLAVAVPLLAGGAVHAHEGDHPEGHQGQRSIRFDLREVNDSGAHATASVSVGADGSITVDIVGTGYTPGAPHVQHLHGLPTGHHYYCPTMAADANGDGQVSTEEAVPQYGDVTVALTTSGDVDMASGLDPDRAPVADAQGRLEYHRTIPADLLPQGLAANIENLHIVQHGLDVNGNGTYDFKALGPSVFAKSMGVTGLPEEATNPATCGEVMPVGAVETGGGDTRSGTPLLLGAGVASLLGAGGALLLRRRATAGSRGR